MLACEQVVIDNDDLDFDDDCNDDDDDIDFDDCK